MIGLTQLITGLRLFINNPKNRDRGIQALISSSSLGPNLDLKPSVNAELSLEEDRIKKFKRVGI